MIRLHTQITIGLILLSLVLLQACESVATKTVSKVVNVHDLYVVDCLLPGQVRRLGNMSYLSPRRPIKTTAVDCQVRGGEYVHYDRADYRSALKVWLIKAEQGDAEAQTYVGEIFEKGLGKTSDFVTAKHWYEKAAQQGYVRAQINLAYLYEKGLGVNKNTSKALAWYRKASGLKDNLMYESDVQQALEELKTTLNKKLLQADNQTKVLQKQIAHLQKQHPLLVTNSKHVDDQEIQLIQAQQEINTLKQLYQRVDKERSELQQEINQLPKVTHDNTETTATQLHTQLKKMDTVITNDINFGRYFALIIANQDYHYLENLHSPHRDASRLQQVLEQHYGFSTVLLADANEKQILNTLNDLYQNIKPEDNLLIYYTGHGHLTQNSSQTRQRGYWLPVDAQQDRLTHWISNAVINDHLDRLKARAILVIADSCYAGNMTSQESPFLLGSTTKNLTKDSIDIGLKRRARLVIASGSVKPILTDSNTQHSLFAKSLIDILQNNQNILRDSMLFAQINTYMQQRKTAQNSQTPEIRPIRAAGHAGGDFYFVPFVPK